MNSTLAVCRARAPSRVAAALSPARSPPNGGHSRGTGPWRLLRAGGYRRAGAASKARTASRFRGVARARALPWSAPLCPLPSASCQRSRAPRRADATRGAAALCQRLRGYAFAHPPPPLKRGVRHSRATHSRLHRCPSRHTSHQAPALLSKLNATKNALATEFDLKTHGNVTVDPSLK